MSRAAPLPAILIDSREQLGYEFENSEIRGLATGDYSLAGLEDEIAIERKSKEDLYGSLGFGRERFQREFERLSAMDFSAVVIESTIQGLLEPPERSRMSGKAVVGSILAWSVRFRVPIYFCDDRRHAQSTTRKLLEFYWKYHANWTAPGTENETEPETATATHTFRQTLALIREAWAQERTAIASTPAELSP